MRKWLVTGTWVLAALILVPMVGGYIFFRSTLPNYQKTIDGAVVSAPVKITRNPYGVPLIEAETFQDAALGLGYTQAQDRLWQMETLRRSVDGTLSQLMGDGFISSDLLSRAVHQKPLAKAKTFERLSPEMRDIFQSFADGVNLAVAEGQGRRSPEWVLLGADFEPWTAADVNTMMIQIIDTATDGGQELKRLRVEEELGPELAEWFYQPLPDNFPMLYRDKERGQGMGVINTLRGGAETDQNTQENAASGYADPELEATGTNFFIVSGERTTSGQPILAVDPHLPSFAPGLLYTAGIFLPDQEIVGAAWIGSPAIAFGHNRNIAWGITHLYADTQDYIVERIDPSDPSRYLTPDGSQPFIFSTVDIPIKGGEALKVKVRSTRNGPVVSDPHLYDHTLEPLFDDSLAEWFEVIGQRYGEGHIVSMKQQHARGGHLSLQAVVNASLSTNWNDFREALRDYEWTNNFAYADRQGNIGVQMSMALPNRVETNDWRGQRPARGWLGEGAWDGLVPFEQQPFVFNPEKGWIADSNGRAIDDRFGLRVGEQFAPPWRASRAYELFAAREKHDMQSVRSVQLDATSAGTRWLLQTLRTFEMTSERNTQAVTMLDGWDGEYTRERGEPVLYSAWELALQERIINSRGTSISSARGNTLLLRRILEEEHTWCDEPDTEDVETCTQTVNAALEQALDAVEQTFGPDPATWKWGDTHQTIFRARYSWQHIPGLDALSEISVASDGGPNTLNAANVERSGVSFDDLLADLSYETGHGAMYRLVADLSDLQNSDHMHAPGASIHLMSPHWADAAQDWADGRYMKLTRPEGREGKRVTQINPR